VCIVAVIAQNLNHVGTIKLNDMILMKLCEVRWNK